MKNNADLEQGKRDLERQDAMALSKRATEDAVEDANSYAFSARPQHVRTTGPNTRQALTYLLSRKNARVRVSTEDEIDGLLIHSCEGSAKLVLSDEISEISLMAEAEALAAEPMSIFHVQAPTPWVQRVRPGDA